MSAKKIPKKWIEEKRAFLKKTLPQKRGGVLFTPDDAFYVPYHVDHGRRLRTMAAALFDWLDIKPQGCAIDFYDEQEIQQKTSHDVAGFYTTAEIEGEKKEIILINAKHKEDTMHVGAILAHEMMHLYLTRRGIALPDRDENELLTDLATIEMGLPILVLNGMSFSSRWWLSLILLPFGFLYWSSRELSFGYFKPYQYARAATAFLKERTIALADILGYVNPGSRRFIPGRFFVRAKQTTEYIRLLERKRRKKLFIQWGVIIVLLLVLIAIGKNDERKKREEQERAARMQSIIQESINRGTLTPDIVAPETETEESAPPLPPMSEECKKRIPMLEQQVKQNQRQLLDVIGALAKAKKDKDTPTVERLTKKSLSLIKEGTEKLQRISACREGESPMQ